MNTKAKLDQSWLDKIGGEFEKPYMLELKQFFLIIQLLKLNNHL